MEQGCEAEESKDFRAARDLKPLGSEGGLDVGVVPRNHSQECHSFGLGWQREAVPEMGSPQLEAHSSALSPTPLLGVSLLLRCWKLKPAVSMG